ncbi:hypothetical protein Acsp03_53640 [Actinomadura sp. NBRC 104412]|uniref:DUF397 domain-containing protein n=1 Tax=Actinomadura sp. NBRC 104412 TaxID=3032203 RepID=UPI0024A42B12|nr:DUF397 domain-containing protein [Actinomadura sp. NBRC 104412]GLZ07898.1 hypothetical protein Acsp03_53640 [Actinomadura sp. NBRC 104412]
MTPVWRKSSRSTTQGGECVEVAALSDAIGLRDSKNPLHGHLALTPDQFAKLLRHIKQDV